MKFEYRNGRESITIVSDGDGSGQLYSTFDRTKRKSDWNTSLDVFEATLLALYSAGCPLDEYTSALDTAFDSIVNRYGED